MLTLRLHEVGARYGRRMPLSGITTPELAGGEVTAVIGPNAAGKSTLLKRIAGLVGGPGRVEATAGPAGGRTRPPRICYLPQDSTANAVLTVYESVLLARKQGSGWRVDGEDLAKIDAVIAALGLSAIAFRNIGELSGGQRQLAGLAQTLVREPDIMLMDEPTAALDLSRQIEVLNHMRTLARQSGIVVLIALHDLNHALRFCDQAIVIAQGGMVASGRVAEVITPALLRSVYGVEARIEPCSRGIGTLIVDGVSAAPPSAS
jgi:iron complex transport system ATP-binding protein